LHASMTHVVVRRRGNSGRTVRNMTQCFARGPEKRVSTSAVRAGRRSRSIRSAGTPLSLAANLRERCI
jgi:hypothetical protein